MTHTYTQIVYHLVWSTKDRQPLILPEFQERLFQYIGGTLRSLGGTCLQTGGMPDHIHILASTQPRSAIADVVRDVKVGATKWVKDNIPLARGFAWQEGYGAFSIDRGNLDPIVAYIQNQPQHHAQQSFRDEFLALLKRYKVDYDERFLWK